MENASYIKFAWIYVGEGSKPFDDHHVFTATWYHPESESLDMTGCVLPEHQLRHIERDTLRDALLDKYGGDIVRSLKNGEYQDVYDAIRDILPALDDFHCVGYVVNGNGDLNPVYLNE